MPTFPKFTVNLYDKNLAAPVFVENLTGRAQNLRFSTVMPGGFAICSFEKVCPPAEVIEWQQRRFFFHLKIMEGSFCAWEGRLEDVAFVGFGLRATFYGYWRSCFDQIYNDSASWQAGSHTAHEIIEDMLTDKCPQISTTYTNIADPGVNLTPQTYDEDEYPGDIIARLAKYSDSAYQRWDFAIWEDRLPWFQAVDVTPSAVDWQMFVGEFETISIERSARNLYNDIYSVYLSGAVKTRTASATNAASQTKYITRQKPITNLGEISAAAATSRRDYELESRREVQQQSTLVLSGDAFDARRVRKPLWHIRAGQVLRITDYQPFGAQAGSPQLNAWNTFHIVRTEYDADRNRMTIYPDTETRRLDYLLAREGIGR